MLGHDSILEIVRALTNPDFIQIPHQRQNSFLSEFGVFVENFYHHFHCDWFFTCVPDIIISYVRHGGVTDLCFSGKKNLRAGGHPDD